MKIFEGKIPPRSEMVFDKVEHDALKLVAGRQIALLSSDQEHLVSLTQKESQESPEPGELRMTFSYKLSEMYFVKIDGAWKMLGQNL